MAAAGGAGADDDAAFKRWAEKLSQTEHKTICAWGPLAHPASKTAGRFVWFTDKARPYANWLVFESDGQRWLFRHDERADWAGKELRCMPGGGQVWHKYDAIDLDFSAKNSSDRAARTITFVDGDLVRVAESGIGYHGTEHTSWIEGTHTWNDPHPLGDSPAAGNQHILFALPEGSRWWGKLPPAPVNVTFGAKRFQRWWAAAPKGMPSLEELGEECEYGVLPEEGKTLVGRVLENGYPDRADAIHALLHWHASGAGPWNGYPAYEKLPEDLLRDYPLAELLRVLHSGLLTRMEMEGAARLLAGWQFWKGREAEKRNVSPDLRNAMAAVVADSGQSDNLERFADTWREK